MTTSRKKLIEVALPLDAINAEAAREKSIRHGHPSTLHLWWARRPLAACRAVLFASLVDDPGNPSTGSGQALSDKEAEAERKRLFGIIEQLVLWENVNDERVLHMARTEIARSVLGDKDLPGLKKPGRSEDWTPAQVREALEKYAPPVLDPFAGGGSIPLEAQRLGLKAYASDLNPVAVLINKALIEIPPKFAGKPPVHPGGAQMAMATDDRRRKTNETEPPSRDAVHRPSSVWKGAAGLAEDVRYYGTWMRAEAEKRIGHLYPKGPNGETVIAWLWARTVKCPNPACGATMPLVRSFALSTKKGRETWVEPQIDKHAKIVSFKVKSGKGKPSEGTVNRRGARCIVCSQPVPFDHVRAEGRAGRMGAQLMAIVTEGQRRRNYRTPIPEHETTTRNAQPTWKPETELPEQALGFRIQLYGLRRHADLFGPRQLVTLQVLTDLVGEAHSAVIKDSGFDDAYANAVATYLALGVSKFANRNSLLTFWDSGFEKVQQTFARQALSMIWDFIEVNPFSESSGNLMGQLLNVVENIDNLYADVPQGQTYQLDASSALPDVATPLVSTDPPYYDNINYADLSDYFYIWLRRSLSKIHPMLFSTLLTPKTPELIAEPGRFSGDRQKAIEHFETGLSKAFTLIRQKAHSEFPISIYYAFRQQETDDSDEVVSVVSTGWEKMLEAVIGAGLMVTGTWPMRTEQAGGLRVIGRNALASSIVLVCRPRPESAPLATRREFVNALKRELPAALTKLMHGGIAPVDLAQAAIGPGMAVFSRYAKVLEADGQAMPVRTALQLINQHLDEYLTAEDSELDKDTRFALAWFQQFGHDAGPFGDADVLARAKDTSVAGMVQAGVLHSKAGKVRLLRRDELAEDWDPRVDARLTVWECAQQLIRRLNEKGEEGTAALARQMGGGRSEDARALAYRLYAICERKKWADEALAYNALVVSWPEIEKKAAQIEGQAEQSKLL